MQTRWTPEMIEAKSIPEPNTGCWLWMAGAWKSGYGSVCDVGGRTRRVHVVSYEVHVGTVPPGLLVLHSCDQPACVNPRHLRAGTQRENMADRRERRRTYAVVGEKHFNASLSDAEAMEIRRRYAAGEQGVALAAEFGVSRGTVYSIASGHRWGHLPPASDNKEQST